MEFHRRVAENAEVLDGFLSVLCVSAVNPKILGKYATVSK
jgi:hypothetical protein